MKRKLTINSQTLQGNIFILTQASISLKSVEGREQVLIQEVKELIYLGQIRFSITASCCVRENSQYNQAYSRKYSVTHYIQNDGSGTKFRKE